MALILKDKPVGVDKSIDTIQNALYTALVTNGTWTNYESYHRAYRNETEGGIVPELFTGNGNDYADAYMNDKFTVTSFFLVDNETGINDDMFTSDISVIFQVNLNKLYNKAPHRFDEEFRNQIVKIFRGLDGSFSFNSITTSVDSVYAGLDTDKVKLNDTHPCHVVRYELTANYQHACDNTFATSDCTISVDVVATAETSLGAADGTATADIGDSGQGNITYSWSTSDGSIKPEQVNDPFIDGLPVGTYTVLVTDDNAVSCTATGSGQVTIPPPLPSCGISIDSIVVVEPSAPHLFDGTATATVSGNAGAIKYIWSDGQTTNPAIGLGVGDICLTVLDLDVLGCSDTDHVEIGKRFEPITWWRASQIDSMNGGTASIGDPVNSWADVSGNIYNLDLTTDTPSEEPILRAGYLEGDGASNLNLLTQISKLPIRSFYVIFRVNDLGGYNIMGDATPTGSSAGIWLNHGTFSSQITSFFGDGTDSRVTKTTTAISTDWILYSERYTSGDATQRVKLDGVAETVTASGVADSIEGTPSNFAVFKTGGSTFKPLDGDIAEVMVFDEDVADSVDSDINDYMLTVLASL